MSQKAYLTDVCDVEWNLIKSMIPAERKRKRGKKREVDMLSGSKYDFYMLYHVR
jgi:putative transposase